MSVMSPMDFMKNCFEAVYWGYGQCHLGKSFQKGYRGGKMCCVRSWPRRQISGIPLSPLSAVNQAVNQSYPHPYLSYILFLNTI